MKDQYQSNETLRIRLSPFINSVTGQYVVSGSDTVTLTIRRPDGTALPGGPHTATWDSLTLVWTFDILVASFQQGEWRIRAESNSANTLPKWTFPWWGDYVDDITDAATAAAQANTRIGAPVGASISADIASTHSRIGAPVGASISADVAAVKTDTGSTLTQVAAINTIVNNLRKVSFGRWRVQGTQLFLYQDDGTTILQTFNLLDDTGSPSGTRVFERVPV